MNGTVFLPPDAFNSYSKTAKVIIHYKRLRYEKTDLTKAEAHLFARQIFQQGYVELNINGRVEYVSSAQVRCEVRE